jgi:hypothetical protein
MHPNRGNRTFRFLGGVGTYIVVFLPVSLGWNRLIGLMGVDQRGVDRFELLTAGR